LIISLTNRQIEKAFKESVKNSTTHLSTLHNVGS